MGSRGKTVELSTGKKLAFAAVTVVGFFLLLEGVLALVGVSPALETDDPYVGFAGNVPLFVESVAEDGERLYVTAKNKGTFFNLQHFPVDKADGTYRIFCLGGSTTYGRPYDDSTSFVGWLRELLQVADPTRRYEVINAGGISYASYRVAELVEELVAYEPDLFVVYTGHNEFLEERTYGDLKRRSGAVRAIAARLASTRIGTVVGRLLQGARVGAEEGRSAADAAGPNGAGRADEDGDDRTLLPDNVVAKLDHSAGLDLYARDDELRAQVVAHYRASLERIVRLAREAAAGVLIVNPASNLRDCTPFKGQATDGLDAETRARVAELVAKRDLASMREAAALDPRNADVRFALGRAELEAGNAQAAAEAFVAARDEDVCPLRALTRLQAAARETAQALDVPFVDYVALLEARTRVTSGAPVPGDDLFLDHVHPTIEGHRLLAVRLIDALIAQGAVEAAPTWGEAAVAEVAARIEANVDRATHAKALANLALTLSWAGKAEESRKLAFRALESGVEDPTVLMMAARHRALEGEVDEAIEYFRRAVRAAPEQPIVHYQFALVLTGQRRLELAAAHALRSIAEWPRNDKTHQELALIQMLRGRPELALASYLDAARIDPGSASIAARVQSIREGLPPGAEREPKRRMAAARFESGRLERLTQAKPDGAGGFTSDGIRVTYHENGLPARFVDLEDGRERGVEVVWGEDGREHSRVIR